MTPIFARTVLPAVLTCCCCFGVATAADLAGRQTAAASEAKLCELTVKAGKHDRANTPVRAMVAVPADLATVAAVTLIAPDGKEIAGQLTDRGLMQSIAGGAPCADAVRELHFILPSLRRGKSTKLTVRVAPQQTAAKGFAWKDAAGQYSELTRDGRPVLCYVYKALDPANREETYKVFHHLFDPSGALLVTKGPGGLYTHHRGIFYGFNRVSFDNFRCDTWRCTDACQTHEGLLAQEAGPVLGRQLAAVAWRREGKVPFAREQRELTAYHVPGGRLVEFASRLTTTGGKVMIDGDPQHAGFQFRAAQEVVEKQAMTYFLRPDGKGNPGDTRNWAKKGDTFVNLRWDAMCFVLGEKRYTVVYLDKPGNPKEARYSERSYGRFGSCFQYEVDKGKDLEVNYRLWLQEGEMTGEAAAALSDDFLEPVEVVVSG